jgi:recombinational DNA repair protein RecR
MLTIQICQHCADTTGSRFCQKCSTPEKRNEVDKNNFENNPAFLCKYKDREWHNKEVPNKLKE